MAEAIYLTEGNGLVLDLPPGECTLEDLIEGYRQGVALNLGCGQMLRPNMVNCDFYYENPLIKKVDARDLSAWADNSVDCIEAQQLLEHLNLDDATAALKEWHRALKPNGRLIISTPDIERILEFISDLIEFHPFMWKEAMRWIYGSQERPGMEHKSGYTPDYLAALLEKIGFEMELVHRYQRSGPALIVIARKL